MTDFLESLASRRRFGMKPGLETIRAVCSALGDPQRAFKAIHVAGTNGKGAVCALLDAALRGAGDGRVGRYTSPHLVRLNERFFLDGRPVDDATLERAAERVERAIASATDPAVGELTFFEALTAVAFLVYAEAACDRVILECGLGGRLDATNVCTPELCVITRIGLDHCDWLGDTVERIAAEKAGIVKPGVPVLLADNEPSVRAVVEARARELGSPFFFAPDLASEDDIPADFALPGAFNRENAVTALAALRLLAGTGTRFAEMKRGLAAAVWPGRFQRIANFIVDGAHNPPAATALVKALSEVGGGFNLIAGFCGDKDVGTVLRILGPLVTRGFAVRTNNLRSLTAEETAARMRSAGFAAEACPSLPAAISRAGTEPTVICGSLFLAGEAVVTLGAYPWALTPRFDPSERLTVTDSVNKESI